MCDRFKESRNVWSSSKARDNPQRVRNNRWSYQQFRLFCVQFLQNNKRKETSLLIIGQFQLNKHWPGHLLVCLETPLKSAFATRKYILVVMISVILDKKKIPHPVPKHLLIPLPGLQSNPISRLDCLLPNPQQYFGQIPDPENSQYSLSVFVPKKKSNAPSSEQVYTIKPPTRGMDFKSNPLLFPALSTPSPPPPDEVYSSGTEIQCIF